jgi:hypothetical protein
MSIEQAVLEVLRKLPPQRQQEVLDFAEFLGSKDAPPRQRQSLEGLWADLGATVSAEDIDEARREMWGDSPREGV